MTVAPPADPRDVQDFQFKLHCRLRIFTGKDETFSNSVNLVVPASKYGLIFVGCPSGIQVITSSSISALDHRGGSGGEISNYPRRELHLPSQPSHLGVSCDQNYLLVAVTKDGCAHGLIYSVSSFTAKNVVLVSEIRLCSKPDTSVLELTWNPGIGNILAACLADGSLAAYEVKSSGLDISTQPPATQATCFCWSPKGKQLVVGTETGTLTQYKPDLKSVKIIPAPSFGSGSVAVVNVLWISNYQFAAIYRDKINIDDRPGLLIVNAPKTGAVTFVNYEDICYSAGELRSPQFYLIHQPAWNILMVASANSMEVGVLGLQEDQISWEQWTQEDAARAELPLTSDKQETFPVGMGLDTSTQNELPWGENQSLPPMPILHILSHQGVLCLFHVVNLKPEAARICAPPEKLSDESGLAFFTTTSSLPAASIMQSGRTQTSADGELGGLRINLASKPDSVSTSQPPAVPSLFGEGPSLTTTPTLSFGSGLGSTSTSVFGSGLAASTSSPGFARGLSTAFGTSVTGFGSGLNNPSNTTPAFGTGTTNPSSLSFGTSLDNQSTVLGSGQNNPPSINFGSTQAAKPASTFQNTATITTTGSAPVAVAAPSSKPSAVQSSANFTFLAPGATSTPQQIPKPSQQQQTPGSSKTQVSFFGSGTSDQPQGGAVNVVKMSTKGEMKESQVKPASPPVVVPPTKPPPLPAVNNSVLFNAINEEITHFGRELAELCSRLTTIKVEVGSDEEKRILCKKVDSMDEFWRELKETTMAQGSEIHGLKSELLEAFAWSEEAKSRTHHLNNPMYLQLTRSQSLDPITARYASNMKHLVYYVEDQLRQVNQQLDSNWLEFQESCKPPVKNKMYIPTLEAVYQAMLMQNNILNKQRVIMADIALRAQEQGRSMQIPLISTAVLARVRDKEASQLGKGETELSRLAENLVQLKLEPQSMHITHQCRRLSRKKELLLRELLSQNTVTRICTTKPLQSMLGGISSGKPIITKIGTPSDTVITEGKISAIGKPESSQTLPFSFSADKTVHELDGGNKSFGTRGFSLISGKTSGPTIATTTVLPNGLAIETNKAKPNIIADNPTVPRLSTNTNEVSNSGPSSGHFTFNNPLQSGKTTVPENFSFTTKLSKVPSVGKLSSASKKLEDYYEEITPPGTPEHSVKEPTPSPVAVVSASSTTFAFSFAPSAKPNILPLSSGVSLQRSPLSSLDNIVAAIGDGSTSIKPVTKPVDAKPPPPQCNTGNAVPFSFGSTSLGQGKSDEIKKPADTFKFSLSSTFNTAPTTSPSAGSGNNLQVTPLKIPVVTTTTIAGISLKTPMFTSFGTENQQSNSTPKLNIFGGDGEGLKSSVPFASSGNSVTSTNSGNIFAQAATGNSASSSNPGNIFAQAATGNSASPSNSGNIFAQAATGNSASPSTSGNIFAQAATSMFGGISTGSPAKQPLSSGSMFGASQSLIFGKQITDTTITTTTISTITTTTATPTHVTTPISASMTVTTESEQKTSESPQKDKISSSSDNLFSQNASLFGNLSMGAPGGAVKPVGNIFGGSSTTFNFGKQSSSSEKQTPGFSFGKQPTSSENLMNPSDNSTAETTDTQAQKTESPAKDTQPASTKPSTSIFDQPPSAIGDGKTEISEAASNQSTTVFDSGNVASTPSTTFSFAQSPAVTVSAPAIPAPSIFAQASGSVKSIFDTSLTVVATTQQPTQPVTSNTVTPATTQTSSTTSSTFTFSLPASTQSLSPFAQKTSVFGQPDGSASTTTAAATTTSTTFFEQPICSPQGFGQSGGSIFGQTATTTSAPSVFGQASTASTSQTIFGQSSSTPLFGQAPTGSSFISGNSGFGKPTFGQSGGSIFGQSGSSTFGSGGGSIFGGGGGAGAVGASVFGGGTGSTSGNLFQSSSGGSIFGGTAASNSGTGTAGAFSSGMGQTISQSGFGSPTAFQSKPGGFGGSPVFDRGTSGFGAQPTFGGAATFGGSPTFNSPGKVFGSTSPASNISFSATGQQQSSTFESLANQNTMSFGNIAQNQGQGFGAPTQSVFGASPQQAQPSSAPSFSSNNAFGGSSFSSWR